MKIITVCFISFIILLSGAGFCVYFDDSSDNDGFNTTPKTPEIAGIGCDKTENTQKTPTHYSGATAYSDSYDFNKAHRVKYRSPRSAQY